MTSGPRNVAIADVNQDGRNDLVVANLADATIGVLRGNGDGTFGTKHFYDLAFSTELNLTRTMDVGDLDQDGKLDFAVASQYEPIGAHVLLGNGDGTFTFEGTHETSNAVNVVIADMNADGLPDLVTDSDVLLRVGAAGAIAARKVKEPVDVATAPAGSARVSPNPLRGPGNLAFMLAKAGPVSVRLFDASGRLVQILRNEAWAEAGRLELKIERRGLAPGIYLYKIDSAAGSTSGRLVAVD
jgi:hypothetical protein